MDKIRALTIGGFVVSAILIVVIFVMVCSLKLVLFGYDRDCGPISAIPFACHTHASSAVPAHPTTSSSHPKLEREKKPKLDKPKRKVLASTVPVEGHLRDPWGCGPLQPEPHRVQGAYHDLGYRANCGLAHSWSDGW